MHRLPFSTLLAFMVSLLLVLSRTAAPEQLFQRIDGWMYMPQRWNDGDLISSPCREKDKPALTCARIFQTFNRRDRRVNGMLCAKIVHRRFAGRHSIIVDDDKAA
jgi:hypothetical protein